MPARGIGFAIKVADGSRRAVEAALVRVLWQLEVLTLEDQEALATFGRPTVCNTLGEMVGEIRADFSLTPVTGGLPVRG